MLHTLSPGNGPAFWPHSLRGALDSIPLQKFRSPPGDLHEINLLEIQTRQPKFNLTVESMNHRSKQLLLAVYMYKVCKHLPAVFSDFKMAFPHMPLMSKVEELNLDHHVLPWINNYLANRHQGMTVNGATSDSTHETSEVPQGSILVPLFF